MIEPKDGAFLREQRKAPGARPSSARFAPALRGDRRISSEGDVVLELLRDARRRPALGRAGARGGGRWPVSPPKSSGDPISVPPPSRAPPRSVSSPRKRDSTTSVVERS